MQAELGVRRSLGYFEFVVVLYDTHIASLPYIHDANFLLRNVSYRYERIFIELRDLKIRKKKQHFSGSNEYFASLLQSIYIHSNSRYQRIRRMMCMPESVSTRPLNCCGSNAKEASSNGLCIWPLPNIPKSPPRSWEPQSLSLKAICWKRRSIAG